MFEVVWEALRLPLMPARIVIDQHGVDEEERRRFVRRAEIELARLGLGSLRRVAPELGELMGVVARHDRALGWRELLGDRRRAYLAARGRIGVQTVIDGDQVRLSRFNADHLVSTLLGLLPPVPAGGGRAFSVPTDTFQHATQTAVDGTGSMEQRALLRRAGVRADQAEQLELLTRTTENTGSISAHRQESHGGAVKLVGSLAYTDTTLNGRYLLLQRPDSAGTSYTSIVPGDDKTLRRHIAELIGAAAPW